MSEVTRILSAAEAGDPQAAAQLLPLVYDELRKLAAAQLTHETPGQTLQPTALVHEAYLRLVGPEDVARWENRGHFFAAAAQAMRRILIEAARRKRGPQRGGHLKRQDLDSDVPAVPHRSEDLLALDEALDQLTAIEPRAAEVAKLRFFAGLTIAQVADALSISSRTADADWAYARAWLVEAVRGED